MSAIEIIENFEGASIGKYHIRGDKVFTTLREEPLVKKDGMFMIIIGILYSV